MDPADAVIERAKARDAAPAPAAEAKKDDAAPAASEAKPPKERKAPGIASLVEREWKATEAQKAADALAGKYRPLEEAIKAKDLVKAMTLMAEGHGLTFTDFVEAFEKAGEIKPKTPEEVARAAAAEELDRRDKERREREEKEAQEREATVSKETEAKIAQMRERLATRADAGGDRWAEAADTERAGEAWGVIERTFFDSGEKVRLSEDDALDIVEEACVLSKNSRREAGKKLPFSEALKLIESKLKGLSVEQIREKLKPRDPSAQGKARTEAAAAKGDGRDAAPSFTNRNTSGVPGAVTAEPITPDLPDHEAIERAARRAIPHVRL